MDYADNDTQQHEHMQERSRVLLEVGMRRPHVYTRAGQTFEAGVAFQSQVLVRDLVKLGMFSMNIHSMAQIDEDRGAKGLHAPISLLAIGMDYAICVAPTLQPVLCNVDDEVIKPVISLDMLDLEVRRLEKHFGHINVDMELVAAVTRQARDREAGFQPVPRENN